ncbi:MAG TPA: dihydrofolate reductase family protein [Allosphingosinicella sp.]|nr:dihydrofolate reductase family protein [Allosphingosinicella sp.]
MRKVTFGGANSLDNYITAPGEALDWLKWSDDAQAISAASWKGVDTMLMGRKTFEFAQKSGGGGGSSKIRTYVFSRTLKAVPDGAELVREDAAGFVRALKQQEGGDIIVMGGGELGTALLEEGVVDEIGFNIHPLLLGGGTPLFHPLRRRIALELIEARAIEHGCVLVRYRVVNEAPSET